VRVRIPARMCMRAHGSVRVHECVLCVCISIYCHVYTKPPLVILIGTMRDTWIFTATWNISFSTAGFPLKSEFKFKPGPAYKWTWVLCVRTQKIWPVLGKTQVNNKTVTLRRCAYVLYMSDMCVYELHTPFTGRGTSRPCGVALVGRINKIIGLFCRRAL